MKAPEPKQGGKKRIVRMKPEEKPRPTPESLERLRKAAEEKGWVKKK